MVMVMKSDRSELWNQILKRASQTDHDPSQGSGYVITKFFGKYVLKESDSRHLALGMFDKPLNKKTNHK